MRLRIPLINLVAYLEPLAADHDHENREHRDHERKAREQTARESHVSARGVRNRYPKPRTVSMRSDAAPSFARSRWMCMSTVRV